MAERITKYTLFWPYYLREHSKATTRRWHYFGSTAGILLVLGFVLTGSWWYLVAALICGYGPAWIGHFFVEKNRPATFQYPFWSLYSDCRMYLMWLSGRLAPELEKAGVKPDGTVETQAA